VFEAAITGRIAMEGSWDDLGDAKFKKASGLIDMMPQSEEEMETIRTSVLAQNGVFLSVLDVLRRVPRRVLMVLKLNDLTRYVSVYQYLIIIPIHTFPDRSLDNALATTHSNVSLQRRLKTLLSHELQIRIFLITAKYCALAIWEDERKNIISNIRTRGLLSVSLFQDYFKAWWYVPSFCVIIY